MKHRSRMMALLLAMALVIGMMPMAVFAEGEEMIEGISLQFKGPSAGEDIAAYIKNCVVSIPDGAEFTVQGIQFYDAQTEEPVSGKFEKKVYDCSITLQANEGYTFKYEADEEDEEYYIWDIEVNDGQARYGLLKSDQIMEVFFNITIGLKPIEKLILTYPEPVVGATPESIGSGTVIAEPEGSLIKGSFRTYWVECDERDFLFYENVDPDDRSKYVMKSTDTFKEGKYYGVYGIDPKLEIADGYCLDSYSSTVTNEHISTMSSIVWPVFGPLGGGEDVKEVKKILLDFPEPKEGQTVASAGKGHATGMPEGSLIEQDFDVVWYESKTGDFSYLNDENADQYMADTDVFKAGYYYGATSYNIGAKASEGYSLPESTPWEMSDGSYYDNPYIWKVYGPLKGTEAKTVSDIFEDVESGIWYEKYLQKAYNNKIITGTSDTTYEPQSRLNHGQIMVMAANHHSNQKGDHYDFQANKKPGDKWYQVFEDYCKTEGIIDDRFDGKELEEVTREEMAYYFANTLTDSSYKDKKAVELNDIAGNPYEAEITKLAKADIVGGKGEGKYDPSGFIIRAEAAVFISNILDAIE